MSMTPNEILNVCDVSMPINSSERVMHLYKKDGNKCSIDKTPACSVTRVCNGWLWNCFRCGEKGFVHSDLLSPTSTLLSVKESLLDKKIIKHNTDGFSLPKDFLPVRSIYQSDLPKEVATFLQNRDVWGEICHKFNVGWSDTYKRLIIPVYDTKDGFPLLIGWVGRDVASLSKEERVASKIPKYINRQRFSSERLLFEIQKEYTYPVFKDVIVVVEDVFSAMKIHHYIGCTTVALLNTNFPSLLALSNKNKLFMLWLDKGQEKNMNDVVKKITSWNIKATMVNTPNDPKDYDDYWIKDILSRNIKGFYK